MTANSFFRIILTMTLFVSSKNSFAGSNKASASSHGQATKTVLAKLSENLEHGLPDAALPAAQPVEHSKKAESMRTEELAHIHHFHKERVKKIKRHHKKYWILSKLILLLCHLVLLICAYLHLTH